MSTHCPRCHAVLSESPARCSECGYRFESAQARPPATARQAPPAGRQGGDLTGVARERLGALIPKLITLAVVAAVVYFGVVGVRHFVASLEPEHPFPLTRQEAATIFFTGLEAGLGTGDYQVCYNLLESGRRVATVIDNDNRYRYFSAFERIARYLSARSGPGFAAAMTLDTASDTVRFPQGVELTIVYELSRDSRDRTRYGIQEIREFPVDKAPSLGLEQHNRDIELAIEGGESDGLVSETIDRAAPVIALRQNESPARRQQRLIQSFGRARMLDTRHTLLETLIQEAGPNLAAIHPFLQSVAGDPQQPVMLQSLARSVLK